MPATNDLIETLAKIRERIAALETEMRTRDEAAAARQELAGKQEKALDEAVTSLKVAVNAMLVDVAKRDASNAMIWKIAGFLFGGTSLGGVAYWFLNWLRNFWQPGTHG